MTGPIGAHLSYSVSSSSCCARKVPAAAPRSCGTKECSSLGFISMDFRNFPVIRSNDKMHRDASRI